MGDRCIVVSTDPCIDVPDRWFGWLLVNYAASDVALFGARPQYCAIDLLGPPEIESKILIRTMNQACEAAAELRIAIVTGHTGKYHGISKLIGTCTAYGEIDKRRLITPANARPGDLVLLVKSIGRETVTNFALKQKALANKVLGPKSVKAAEKIVPQQSCVREALLIAGISGVRAMHDATEGGFVAALNEMADASRVGFSVEFDGLPIDKNVVSIGEYFKLTEIQMLSMSSTGTFLVALSPSAKERVEELLRRHHIEANIVGIFSESTERVLVKRGRTTLFPKIADDPYNRILSGAV